MRVAKTRATCSVRKKLVGRQGKVIFIVQFVFWLVEDGLRRNFYTTFLGDSFEKKWFEVLGECCGCADGTPPIGEIDVLTIIKGFYGGFRCANKFVFAHAKH
jgi:hypothetical protein